MINLLFFKLSSKRKWFFNFLLFFHLKNIFLLFFTFCNKNNTHFKVFYEIFLIILNNVTFIPNKLFALLNLQYCEWSREG